MVAQIDLAGNSQNCDTPCPVSHILTRSLRSRSDQPFSLVVHADMLKISTSDIKKGIQPKRNFGSSKRGTIRQFSRSSRKRMIEFMAKVRYNCSLLFATLTYPDLFPPDDPECWHDDFEAFRRRFERAYPDYRAIWRMELKERLSGENIGEKAPHFHLIIFLDKYFDEIALPVVCNNFWAWMSNNWSEIAAYEDENHILHGTDCTIVRSRKHAYAYVSKYVGKISEDTIDAGRRWGRIGKFDTSHSETFNLSDDEYIELRRLVKKWLKSRKNPYAKKFAKQSANQGCTIFGMGDTDIEGNPRNPLQNYWQFICEVERVIAERKQLERGYGD